MKYQIYDSSSDRLVWYVDRPGERYWDDRWTQSPLPLEDFVIKYKPRTLMYMIDKYLPAGKSRAKVKILEAGCGRGQIVYHLDKAGFEAYGIDSAARTVEQIRASFPHLRVSVQDVRDISCGDSFYDICISLGVIEHFQEGPGDVFREMHRVTKKDGLIFLSVPWISPIRKLKLRCGLYAQKPPRDDLGFYQYAYSLEELRRLFRSHHLKIRRIYCTGGLKGLRDEVMPLRPLLLTLRGLPESMPWKILTRILDRLTALVSGHMGLFILQPIKD